MEKTAMPQAVHAASADGTGMIIRDPRTGDVLWSVAEPEPRDVAHAVEVARSAGNGWAATAAAERGACLREAARALAAAAAELAGLNASETGRPVNEALAGIAAGVSTLEQYAELGPVHRGRSLNGKRFAADYTVAEPRGVAVLLTPWRWPAG